MSRCTTGVSSRRDPLKLTGHAARRLEFGGRIFRVVIDGPDADAFHAYFAPEGAVVASTTEVAPGVMIDLHAFGRMIGIEVSSVRLRGAGAPAKAESSPQNGA